MSTTLDPKILAKIKKCLALAGSPNPNEAAIAMRQAHALMRAHGVDAHHITASSIGESSVASKTMARDKPAQWEVALVGVVGKAFGCKLLVRRSLLPKEYKQPLNQGSFIFIGEKAQAEIAAYTASVLIRKCKTARQRWIAENLAGLSSEPGGRAQATRMGDAFADGWVYAISKLVADFANPPELAEAIDKIIENRSSSSDPAPTRRLDSKAIGEAERAAARMGIEAAKGESLYRPMHQAEAPVMIGVVSA